MTWLIPAVLTALSVYLPVYADSSGRVMLPAGVYPAHYDVNIAADATHLTFKGSVAIDLEVKVSTPVIELNAVDLVFDRVVLEGRGDAPRVSFDKARESAAIAFAQPIVPGKYRLEIDYRGKINEQASGLFALDYLAADRVKKRALYTQFENSDARRFMPCWDEPGIKSTFTLSLDIPSDEMAVSNMPVDATNASAGARKRVRFAATPKMSVYLLFAAVGDFERVHRMIGKTDVGVVVKRGDTLRASFALDTEAQLLPYFNDYFGVPFPLPKLDLIAAPGSSEFLSAMENWGALFHFEDFALVDSRLSTPADRQQVYIVIAHEMAHQWFGDLVTVAWWDDLWLNEGFASWMENKATDRFHPEWKVWLQERGEQQRAMRLDAANGTHPIITPIKNVIEAGAAFDDITYVKGAGVIRMLEAYVGEDVFRAGVRSYLKAYAYGNTVSDDLWKHVDAAGGKKITDIAHDFTLQAGVPLIAVGDVRCAAGRQTFNFSQSRFAIDDSGKRGAQIWRVPVQFGTTADNTVASAEVRGKPSTVASIAGCEALLVNPGQAGYYRIRYDASAAAALKARFRSLAADDQLGLLDNAAALAFAGQAPLAEYLDLTRTLPPAADPIVWSSLADELSEIDRLLDGQAAQPGFRAYARTLLQPVFEPLGWDTTAGESDNTALLRAALIDALGQMGDPEVISQAQKRFLQLAQTPDSVGAAARKAALNVVAMRAEASEWERLRALARSAATEVERSNLYAWLASSIDTRLAQDALDLALTDEAPITVRNAMIRTAAYRHPELVMDFAIAHWAQIAARVEPDFREEFAARLARLSADRRTIERLNRFVQMQFPGQTHGAAEKAAGEIRYRAQLKDRLIDAFAGASAGPRH